MEGEAPHSWYHAHTLESGHVNGLRAIILCGRNPKASTKIASLSRFVDSHCCSSFPTVPDFATESRPKAPRLSPPLRTVKASGYNSGAWLLEAQRGSGAQNFSGLEGSEKPREACPLCCRDNAAPDLVKQKPRWDGHIPHS